MMAIGATSGALWEHNYDSQVHISIDRRRDLLRSFLRLSEQDQDILWAALGPHQYPRSVSAVLPAIEGPALALMPPEDLLKLCNRITTGAATPQDRGKLSDLRMRSELAYTSALSNFTEHQKANE